ncbi:serine hydrolase domain-containing protein [Alloacidobacterium sp.]|uniref:serine hydrolase domain-containing protein n=1 Tax=Alloacidobacterium sp. TaxID=2951999 RepID=UPI002D5F0E6A|nr:serine hydrolase domain-containing protein [Alloacidobacterium sp.]HYK37099.1 serine hydrolase domain-containing protein [Alloacidobacterium sp.]
MRRYVLALIFSLLAVAATIPATAQTAGSFAQPVDTIPADLRGKIDAVANKVLADTGVPSASIAIVQKGQIVYTNAYGKARLDPPTPAAPQMRYSVGSISKQFTAASILLLQQQGKLSIDDPVSKYVPGLTRGDEVTIRMLLSHTSGYQDYWPEDYLMPPMRKPATAQYILDTWAKKPLDFDPGTKWQYSNTNYVIAGVIVEKLGGEPLMRFLQQNVFTQLDMKSVYNTDVAKLGDTDAAGYIRYALGPLRPAPKEGAGWMFAAGELAMPAHDLALWDISIMNRSLLAPESYKQMFTSVKLKDGTDSHYGLGLFTGPRSGHAALEHSGEVSGFVSENIVFPDDKAAIVVLTNQDASPAASAIGRQLTPIVLGLDTEAASQAETQGLAIFKGLQQGQIDRTLFTDNCNAYFDSQALGDFSSSLKPLGEPATFHQMADDLRGGMTFRVFAVTFKESPQRLRVTTYTMPDGKLEQYLVIPAQ